MDVFKEVDDIIDSVTKPYKDVNQVNKFTSSIGRALSHKIIHTGVRLTLYESQIVILNPKYLQNVL